jgi:hypothetical protein
MNVNTRRKLQFSAALVIVNGLAALVAMSPRPAHASNCTSLTYCLQCVDMSFCEAVAPPGCKAIGYSFCNIFECQGMEGSTCLYEPI